MAVTAVTAVMEFASTVAVTAVTMVIVMAAEIFVYIENFQTDGSKGERPTGH